MTRSVDYVLRVVVAAMLVISGLVHVHLAENYPIGKYVTQEDAFVVQAVVVFVLAAAVLLLPVHRTLVWVAVLVVSAASLGALVLSRYWDGVNDLPVLVHEPLWEVGDDYLGMSEKVLAAVTEAIATVLALVALALQRSGNRVRA